MSAQATILDNFWSKVEKTTTCWNWKGYRMKNGYGQFQVNGEHILAHRFVYELFNSTIPENLTIDHLCKNRACVNPEHLEAVTMRTNLMRSDAPSAINARKTHCPRGHALTGDNLNKWAQKRGMRQCKTCFTAWQHARYQRLKKQKMHKEMLAALRHNSEMLAENTRVQQVNTTILDQIRMHCEVMAKGETVRSSFKNASELPQVTAEVRRD